MGKHKNIVVNEYTEMYNHVDYIRKANYELFRNTSPEGQHNYTAYTRVKRVNFDRGRNELIINGRYYTLTSLPVIITLEEGEARQAEWETIKNMEIKESVSKDFEHFREDNGEPKISYNSKSAREVLFKFRGKNPDGHYDIYLCSVCGGIHMGKTQFLELNNK